MKKILGLLVATATALGGCATAQQLDTDTVAPAALVRQWDRQCTNFERLTSWPLRADGSGSSDVSEDLNRMVYYECKRSGF